MPASARFVFTPFELDKARRRLIASGEPLAISDRQLDVLLLLVERAGQIVSKDDLIQAAWKDVAVGDNSLEQAISSLRRLLAAHADGVTFIETVARRGYRFGAAVSRLAARESDASLDALLGPHRAFIEGRAALETLEADQVARAHRVFEDALGSAPEHASAHIGMANACIMQFEMTRADSAPDIDARTTAAHHAREACRLDAQSAEAWATLGFVLDRMGESLDARAALRRAVTLEPDNWRHQLRLAYVSWGEERLRAAHRALALLPDFPLAHWLAATVLVARQVLPEAEREIEAGLAAQAVGASRFNAVGLNWMLGLIRLARDDFDEALDQFERELSCETGNQLYARECAANTWYAIGALRLRQQRPADATRAFECALERIPIHPLAQVGFAAAESANRDSQRDLGEQNGHVSSATAMGSRLERPLAFEAVLGQAARQAVMGKHVEAARIVDDLLAAAPPGNAAWLLPIEPLLHVAATPDCWARPLARLRNRAA